MEADAGRRSLIKSDFRRFVPHPLLLNGHLMTVVPGFLPRGFKTFLNGGIRTLLPVSGEAKLLGHCHFQSEPELRKRPLLIILHGLEGSSESSHVVGIGHKAFACGLNVLRLNMRNCGGAVSMENSQTLYNGGMFQDVHAVMRLMMHEHGFTDFILAGYSLGGNIMLNAAAEHDGKERIRAVCVVSPAIDLAVAVDAIEHPRNQIYQHWFLRTLKRKLLEKSKQFPEIYRTPSLKNVTTIREFDDRFTAPLGGYGNAEKYYREASSISKIKSLNVPALIITAKDDPLVPVSSFLNLKFMGRQIDLLITEQGGHGGFYQKEKEERSLFDHFWAENRIIEYIEEVNSN